MKLTAISGLAHFCVPTDDVEEVLNGLRLALHTPGFGVHHVGPFTVTKQPTMFTISDGITWLTVPLSDASELLDQMAEMRLELGDEEAA